MIFKNQDASSDPDTPASLNQKVDIATLEYAPTNPVDELMPRPSEDPNDPLVSPMLPYHDAFSHAIP